MSRPVGARRRVWRTSRGSSGASCPGFVAGSSKVTDMTGLPSPPGGGDRSIPCGEQLPGRHRQLHRWPAATPRQRRITVSRSHRSVAPTCPNGRSAGRLSRSGRRRRPPRAEPARKAGRELKAATAPAASRPDPPDRPDAGRACGPLGEQPAHRADVARRGPRGQPVHDAGRQEEELEGGEPDRVVQRRREGGAQGVEGRPDQRVARRPAHPVGEVAEAVDGAPVLGRVDVGDQGEPVG